MFSPVPKHQTGLANARVAEEQDAYRQIGKLLRRAVQRLTHRRHAHGERRPSSFREGIPRPSLGAPRNSLAPAARPAPARGQIGSRRNVFVIVTRVAAADVALPSSRNCVVVLPALVAVAEVGHVGAGVGVGSGAGARAGIRGGSGQFVRLRLGGATGVMVVMVVVVVFVRGGGRSMGVAVGLAVGSLLQRPLHRPLVSNSLLLPRQQPLFLRLCLLPVPLHGSARVQALRRLR